MSNLLPNTKTVNLLRTLRGFFVVFLFLVIMCHSVFTMWPKITPLLRVCARDATSPGPWQCMGRGPRHVPSSQRGAPDPTGQPVAHAGVQLGRSALSRCTQVLVLRIPGRVLPGERGEERPTGPSPSQAPSAEGTQQVMGTLEPPYPDSGPFLEP